ncbi:MAG TPA: DUF559 domain-containing protein, partial [Acidimicrobiales bacterium]
CPMELWAVAAAQHGAVAFEQLVEAEIPTSVISDWVASGRLVRIQPRTYAVAGSPDSFHRRCWAALLSAGDGAALSHRSAAFLWKLLGGEEPPIEIVVPRGRTPDLRGVIVHQTRDPFTIHRRDGLLVTSPLRAVVDLGAVAPDWVVSRAVDMGRVANLFTISALEWQLVEVARQGRRGTGALRRVLDRWALAKQRPDGMLEPRFARLRVRHGLPEPVFQYEVGPYRLDFAYPIWMIAIEVDGYEAHGTAAAMQRDLQRQNYLVANGWTVLRFTWTDVVKRPHYVAKIVAAAIGRAHAGIPA